MLQELKALIDYYGLPLVFAAAFLEGIPPLGWWVPGLSTLVVAGIVASQGSLSLPAVVATASVATMFSYWLDFAVWRWLGFRFANRLGMRRTLRRMTCRLRRASPVVFAVLLAHPTSGAVALAAAGILRRPFRQVAPAIFIAGPCWATIWLLVGYVVGPAAIQVLSGSGALGAIAGAAVVVAIVEHVRSRAKTRARTFAEDPPAGSKMSHSGSERNAPVN